MNLKEASIKRYYNIDFLRLVFAAGIVYFHILHANIMSYTGNIVMYKQLQKLCDGAGYIVECFFIMAGYFLYISIEKSKEKTFVEFVTRKLVRLWPVVAFCCLLEVIFFGAKPVSAFMNAFFLQCVGVTIDFKGINWFISPYFWGMLFYAGLLRVFNKKTSLWIIAIIVYFSYVANISACKGGFGRATVYGILNLGMLRALAGMGLGIGLSVLCESLEKNCVLNLKPLWAKMIASCVEIFSGVYLFSYFFLGYRHNSGFILVQVFTLLLLAFVYGKGIISNLLNYKIWSILAQYSYSVYIMQQISFYIMRKTLWTTSFVSQVGMCLTISTLFSVLIGGITFYLVEKPGYALSKFVSFRKAEN